MAALGMLLGAPAAGDTLLVGAASSLREPVEQIASAFEAAGKAEVDLTFGASSFLAAQVEAGAPIDVLLSADERSVDRLAEQGLVSRRIDLAGNRLVVLAAADRDLELTCAEDLLQPGVERLAVPEPAVPLGHYARAWLAQRELLEPLRPRLVPTENARATLSAVDVGNVDAAIVYATDALLARSADVAFEVPPEQQPRIAYQAAVVAGAEPAQTAQRFLRFLQSREARKALREAGFRPPPDPAESGGEAPGASSALP